MSYAKELWMSENEQWFQDYIDRKIDRDELEQFLVRRYFEDDEINDLIHELDKDRLSTPEVANG